MLVVFGESDLAIAFVINVFPAIINVVQKWKRNTRNTSPPLQKNGYKTLEKGKISLTFVLSSILL